MARAGRDLYNTEELQAREAAFFNKAAMERPLNTRRIIAAHECFPHVTPAGCRLIKAHLGALEGRRVLDLGCGSGYSTVLLARLGARVTAIDLSEKYLEYCRERVAANGIESQMEWVGQMGAEHLEFRDASFDAVYGSHILHHTQISQSVPEVARVLKPGAPAAFVETLGTNPFFRLVRGHLAGRFGIPKFANETECPLRSREIRFIRRHFRTMRLRGDLCLSMLSGYVLRGPKIERFLKALDGRLFHLAPFLSKLAYAGILLVSK